MKVKKRKILKKILFSFGLAFLVVAIFVGIIVYNYSRTYSKINTLYKEINTIYRSQANFINESKKRKKPEVRKFVKKTSLQLKQVSLNLNKVKANIDDDDKELIKAIKLMAKTINSLKSKNDFLKYFGVFTEVIEKGQLSKANKLINRTLKDPNAKDFNGSKRFAQQALNIYQKISMQLNKYAKKFNTSKNGKIIKESKEYIALYVETSKIVIEASNISRSSVSKYNRLINKFNSNMTKISSSKYSDADDFLDGPIYFVDNKTASIDTENTIRLNGIEDILSD